MKEKKKMFLVYFCMAVFLGDTEDLSVKDFGYTATWPQIPLAFTVTTPA
jgi:hypothetical protein